jgi:hypothetical protein
MFLIHTPISPAETVADEVSNAPAAAVCAGDVRLLDEMAGFGMNLLRAMDSRVTAACASDAAAYGLKPLFDPAVFALAFCRISRAVRLTLAMKAQLLAGELPILRAPALRAAPAVAASGAAPADAAPADAVPAAIRVLQEVESAVAATIKARPETETGDLYAALGDWTDAHWRDDFTGVPAQALYLRLCNDIGLPPDAELCRRLGWRLPAPEAQSQPQPP